MSTQNIPILIPDFTRPGSKLVNNKDRGSNYTRKAHNQALTSTGYHRRRHRSSILNLPRHIKNDIILCSHCHHLIGYYSLPEPSSSISYVWNCCVTRPNMGADAEFVKHSGWQARCNRSLINNNLNTNNKDLSLNDSEWENCDEYELEENYHDHFIDNMRRMSDTVISSIECAKNWLGSSMQRYSTTHNIQHETDQTSIQKNNLNNYTNSKNMMQEEPEIVDRGIYIKDQLSANPAQVTMEKHNLGSKIVVNDIKLEQNPISNSSNTKILNSKCDTSNNIEHRNSRVDSNEETIKSLKINLVRNKETKEKSKDNIKELGINLEVDKLNQIELASQEEVINRTKIPSSKEFSKYEGIEGNQSTNEMKAYKDPKKTIQVNSNEIIKDITLGNLEQIDKAEQDQFIYNTLNNNNKLTSNIMKSASTEASISSSGLEDKIK
ncbi:hypothetical protein cand_036090 [Cryptosporidium andersoni]|uniref:Uncharacterized protein n=1 Tax=Cryptosporidium andersoni TaxID=117008 RepID=A0A1J4MVM4_9CRYT|nr:hypothetical protein cand_036090 [Cryptosporidium andersoni]